MRAANGRGSASPPTRRASKACGTGSPICSAAGMPEATRPAPPGLPTRDASDANDPPRARRIIRLIAAERLVRGILLLLAGGYLVTHQGSDFGRLADRLAR